MLLLESSHLANRLKYFDWELHLEAANWSIPRILIRDLYSEVCTMLKWKIKSSMNSSADTSSISQYSSSLADSDEILIDTYNNNVSHQILYLSCCLPVVRVDDRWCFGLPMAQFLSCHKWSVFIMWSVGYSSTWCSVFRGRLNLFALIQLWW